MLKQTLIKTLKISTMVILVISQFAFAQQTLTVTKTEDTDDGVCDGDCSIREAIDVANSGDIIEIPAGTYTLTLGSNLSISTNLTLNGAAADSTIVQAATTIGTASWNVFAISSANVTITNVTIRHGYGSRVGGGIWINGDLTLTSCTVSYNTGRWGGSIFLEPAGSLQLINSTVSNNTTTMFSFTGGYGGGGIAAYNINNNSNSMDFTNSTISDNTDNTSRGYGGIYSFNSTSNLVNTIIANNSGSQCGGGGFTSLGHNIVSDNSGALSGTGDLNNTDPLLGPLQNNGGPSFTHAVLVGSPAIDTGDDSAAPETDQRGYGRNGVADIGAFEYNGVVPLIPTIGLITFTSNRDGNNEVYVMNPDGSNQTNLSNNSAGDLYPTLSPGGTQIVFNSDRDGDQEIYRMDIDGSNLVQLTNNSFNDQGPVFSPDASKIAYYNYEFGRTEVFVMDADGTNKTRLTGNSGYVGWNYGAVWSPDGSRIAFRSDRGSNSNIWLMDAADGANLVNLTNSSPTWEEGPSWSPDGNSIAFHSQSSLSAGDNKVWVINVDGSNLTQLTASSSDYVDYSPCWSPDGSQIAFTSNRNGNSEIFIMDSDGSNQVNITSNTGINDWRPWWGAGIPIVAPILSVSPDSLDFGNLLVGSTSTKQVTVKNTGTADLTIDSIAISGVDSVNFGVDTTQFTLAPGDSILMDVNFTPYDTGSFSASLAVDSDGGSASVALTGIGAENHSPLQFSLITPTDSSEVTTLNPLLEWESAFDPDQLDTVRYTLYFGNDIPNLQSVNADTSTNYQFIAPLMDNTTYYWKVVASDLHGASIENNGGYWSFRVNAENDLPGDFALLSPENGSMVTDLTPTFNWNVPIDPDDLRSRSITSYDLYLGFDSSFTAVEPISVDSNQHTPVENIAEDHLYYWKVVAFDDDGGSAESNIWSFWTNNQNSIPSYFNVINPINSIDVDTIAPTFAWHPSIDDDLNDMVVYNIYLGENIEDIEPVYTGFVPWISDTSFTLIEPIEDNTTYYWNVVATDLTGATHESEDGFQTFNVNLGNEPPSQVTLIAPIESSIQTNLQPHFYWTEAEDPDPQDSITYNLNWWPISPLPVIYGVVLDTNGYVPTDSLTDNSLFAWRVEASDLLDSNSMSDTSYFYTDAFPEPPLAFNTLFPSNDDMLMEDTTTLIWNSTIDPDPLDNVTYAVIIGGDYGGPVEFDTVYVGTDTSLGVHVNLAMTYEWYVIAKDNDNMATYSNGGNPSIFHVVDLGIDNEILPIEFALRQNYPNPFNPVTTLRYDLPEQTFVTFVIYDLLGREVKTLVNQVEEPGYKSVIWNGTNNNRQLVGAGVYLYRISSNKFTKVNRMILLR
ncbi:MAG: PD40 domain-containing protein [Candidatus Marinimicrobia bacterium]|nr:PD40 domain-containing protein [Candidatus Neomarinimicrobiota bacterium]